METQGKSISKQGMIFLFSICDVYIQFTIKVEKHIAGVKCPVKIPGDTIGGVHYVRKTRRKGI